MEKYCALDALWYPQWMKLSLYCEIFGDVKYGMIRASLEMPERANFMLTVTRKLALLDEAPGAEGNPMSTRFHWRAPLHQYLWRDLQQGEIPRLPHFQLYPQSLQRQRIDIARFQRAMLSHIQPSPSSAASTFTGSKVSLRVDNAPSTTTSHAPEVAAGSSGQEQNITVDSDAESVDTTAAVVFAPVNKIKKSLE